MGPFKIQIKNILGNAKVLIFQIKNAWNESCRIKTLFYILEDLKFVTLFNWNKKYVGGIKKRVNIEKRKKMEQKTVTFSSGIERENFPKPFFMLVKNFCHASLFLIQFRMLIRLKFSISRKSPTFSKDID